MVHGLVTPDSRDRHLINSLRRISSEAHTFPATSGGVWDEPVATHEGPPVAGAARALLPSLALGVVMLAITFAVSARENLPVRDADGILGSRLPLLILTIAAFAAIDVVPRAGRACGWRLDGLGASIARVARERWSWKRLGVVVLGIVAFYATYLAYRNLKSFLPLITPQDMDPKLLRFERGVLGGTNPFEVLHTILGTGVAAYVLSWVYIFFLAFVPISLGASLIASMNPLPGLWWVLTLGVNWTLGTLSYYLVPTMGPYFIVPHMFADLPETGVSHLQASLWTERLSVLSDPGATSAVQSIAGFASLHASIMFSAVLTVHLLGLHRLVRLAISVLFVLTMLSTIYFGWHYVVDDLAGIAIGAFSVWIAALLTGNRAALRRLGTRRAPA